MAAAALSSWSAASAGAAGCSGGGAFSPSCGGVSAFGARVASSCLSVSIFSSEGARGALKAGFSISGLDAGGGGAGGGGGGTSSTGISSTLAVSAGLSSW